MFSVYKTVHPPTGIDNSVFCNFLDENELNLITSSANRLQVYRLNQGSLESQTTNALKQSSAPLNNAKNKLKLECVEQFTFYGQISSIKSCRYRKSMTKDALIIAFADAKVSIVEYNTSTGDLQTVSIHYFENEINSEGIHYNTHPPILKVDPDMRCACMLIYGFKLVIIPFYEDHSSLNNNHQFNSDEKVSQVDVEESSKPNADNFKSESSNLHENSFVHKSEKMTNNQSSITSLSSYTIDLRKLDNWLEMRIVDIEFLYGYYEPTLFILSESNMTWVGRYAVKKDTCNSVALSINLNQKTHPIIWPVDKLPSDCIKCLAVPLPIGGVLLFAVNSLIYINQSVPSYGISLNSIAKTTSNYPFKSMEHVRITLDNSQAVFVGSNQLFVSLKGGEIYIITMLTDFESLRTVRNFNIEKGPGSVISSCLVKCADNFLFIGSRLANSVLLKYNVKSNSNNPQTTSTISFQKELILVEENAKQREKSNEIPMETVKNDDIINDMLDYQELMLNQQKAKETLFEQQQQQQQQQKSEQDDLDRILDINQTKTQNQADIVSYTFEICDILLNIAPCGFSIVSESPGDHSEFEQNSMPYHIDLVTSSGHTKNGAISVLQRSLRPEIITSFEIADIVDMWSVSNETDSQTPTFLFLTKADSTIVLQMGNEITELDKENSIFCTRLATICCANLSNNKFIIQITTNDLLVYADCSSLDAKVAFSLDISPLIDSKLKFACVCDPYVVILCENGAFLLFLFDETSTSLKLISNSVKSSSFEQEDEQVFGLYSSVTLYKDESGLFSVEQESKKDEENLDEEANEEMDISSRNESSTYISPNKKLKSELNASGKKKKTKERFVDEMNIDDEDELLYGSSNIQVGDSNSSYISKLLADSKTAFNNNMNNKSFTGENSDQPTNYQLKTKYTRQVSYWLVGASLTDGNLTFFQLNEDQITPMYVLYKFNSAPKTLAMNTASSISSYLRQASLIGSNQQKNVQIEEISLMATGLDRTRTLLLAKIDEDLIIYEAFLAFDEKQSDLDSNPNKYRVSFKRLNHEIVIRDKKKRKKNIAEKRENNELDDDLERNLFNIRTSYTPCFRFFSNIAGYNGFFVSGLNSYLCFMCPRSGLVAHPLWIDGSILSFTAFTNASITLSGFIYMNKNFNIRICNLPTEDTQGKQQIHYDSHWILKKIQLRQTVHFICYHEESKTFAVVTSTSEPTNKLMQLGGEDKELETFERDENFILPHKSQFYLQLYTPNTWEQLPLGKYTLAEWEHVSSLKLVNLPYEGHSSGFRTYLAASTVNCYNEDVNSRGRIILFDIIEAVPEPDKPLTSIKMKVVFEKEQKGPVSCLESVNGYLIGGVGQKIFIWEYKNNELIGKAFIDTHFFIHKMVTLKNFVLIADLHRSISLIRFQQDYTKLSYVAKDKQIIDAYTCEYLVDNTNLAFLASDAEKNISVYMYQNESHDNQGGQWLIRKAEFNVGSHINSMFRLKCRVSEPTLDKKSTLADRRQVTYCTTLDGGVGYVMPISEKTFRRLFILQNAIIVMKQHYGGLNPKAYRSWRAKRKELVNPQKNILDGDLLFEFMNMSFVDRNEIAKKIKTSTEQLLDDLTEIYQLSCHF